MILGSLLPPALAGLAALELARAAPTDAEVARLFKRQEGSGPEIGSDAWQAQYPPAGSTPTNIPQAWRDALKHAEDAGLIPDIPVAILKDGWPSYPDGVDPMDPSRCHYTVGCVIDSDRVDAPDGRMGISFDDGPVDGPSQELNAFLKQENILATHFYIGANVVYNSAIALEAAKNGGNLAIHTWTHPYLSGLTNEELLGELGWCMQVIADINGGRIPSHWRPPFGDVDLRVRAVAREVFGLGPPTIWNDDSEDWHLGTGASVDEITNRLQGWVDGPTSPGLNILEHELYDGCVTAFKSIWPTIKSRWDYRSIPDTYDAPWYKNALTGDSEVFDAVPIANTSAVAFPKDAASSSAAAAPSSSAFSASASASASRATASTLVSSRASASGSSSLPVSSNAASAPAKGADNTTSAGSLTAPTTGFVSLALVLLCSHALGFSF